MRSWGREIGMARGPSAAWGCGRLSQHQGEKEEVRKSQDSWRPQSTSRRCIPCCPLDWLAAGWLLGQDLQEGHML